MNADAITAVQRARHAIVYIRQSTERQVLENKESQRRQRDLVERALDLGWPREQVVQIDEDQGKSGASMQERSGFRRMVAEAALGDVGIIIALKVARVSRSNHDWYHLLDICAVTGTWIADAEGIYDSRSHNDRLLLGLKATMSGAEFHTLKQRLVEAVRSKAARGEFRCRLPARLECDANRPAEHAAHAMRVRVGRPANARTSVATPRRFLPAVDGPEGPHKAWRTIPTAFGPNSLAGAKP